MLQLLKNLNSTRYVILNRSRRRGIYVFDDASFLLSGIKPLVFFDIGANVGQTTLAFSKAFRDSSIYAFEPVESTMSELRRRTAGLANVKYHQTALGAEQGQASMEIREHSAINSLLPDLNDIEGSIKCGEATVAVETVDAFCSKQGIREIHLLKTDTEGFDLEVLKGAQTFLAERRISLILTEAGVHPGDRRHTSLSSLMQYLQPLGYYLFCLYDFPLRDCARSGEFFNALFVRNDLQG
jgi:FkbM family methyltransferase